MIGLIQTRRSQTKEATDEIAAIAAPIAAQAANGLGSASTMAETKTIAIPAQNKIAWRTTSPIQTAHARRASADRRRPASEVGFKFSAACAIIRSLHRVAVAPMDRAEGGFPDLGESESREQAGFTRSGCGFLRLDYLLDFANALEGGDNLEKQSQALPKANHVHDAERETAPLTGARDRAIVRKPCTG